MKKFPRHIRGFTLIEMIMSIVVIAIVGVITAVTIYVGVESYLLASRRMGLTQEARGALVRMVREIRGLDKRMSGSNMVGIITANVSTFRFLDGSNNDITFDKSGTTLRRSGDAQATWDVLANNVSALTFKYYDSSNAELTSVPLSQSNINNIRWLSAEVTLTSAGQSVKMRSQVFPRDFGQ